MSVIEDLSTAHPLQERLEGRLDPVGVIEAFRIVKETVPGINRATASAQVKPATLETGLVVQVPPFVNEGDKVRVSTETGEYQSRA